MESKRNHILVLISITITLSVIIWNITNSNEIGKKSNFLKDIDALSIKEITIYNPIQYYSITEKNDILKLWHALQSMVLRSKPDSIKDGCAYRFDVQLNNGQKVEINVLAKDIHINGHNYQPEKDYCGDIGILFDELSKKYQINPA